jgi:hypothetical protein
MKLLPWLVKIGGSQGLQNATYYTFPTGYQSLWAAVAQGLNVKLSSEVTAITRRSPLDANPVTITANGTDEDFDVVIISAPLNRVGNFVALTSEEKELFSQVTSERYDVSLFTASGLPRGQVSFFYNNANPSQTNHVDAWANQNADSPAYVAYQISDWSATNDQITKTLAGDVASQGGTFGNVFLRQDWDYFPHVSTESLNNGFYYKVEALQGDNNTFYVGGTLSFETVEHSARYAQALVKTHFPTPILP